jgi:HSP20 family protein
MTTRALTRTGESLPLLFDDFLRPWNDWFDGGSLLTRTLTIPAVNIIENKDDYLISLAVPGMKKEDFKIDVEGNFLTISCEKEEKKEIKHNRREFNYSSFSRSFNLPEEVNKEKIDAHYEDGVLKLNLPKKEEVKKQQPNKHIAVK